MSESNYTGNIIINLASLPEFLRKPILKKRLMEFFTMSPAEKAEIVNNALAAGPTIPFDRFAKLFKTWLEVMSTVAEEQRTHMFSNYIKEITDNPHKLVLFNLDGILEVFLTLDQVQKYHILNSLKKVVNNLDEDRKGKLYLIVPDNAKKELGI
ncbi:MAG: hypothetical protein ACE5JT_01645 [Nitrosopumilaceae archaeon]